jgi:hypothetical protein
VTLFGPYLVACTLLVVAGLGKSLRPSDTARALAVLAPRLSPRRLAPAIRLLALAEALLGAAAALLPGRVPAGAVALSYAAFAAFVAYVRLRHGALASCGCFSTPDTPATWLHVVVNLGLAAAAAVVSASAPTGTLAAWLGRQPLRAGPLIVLCALAVWLTHLTLVGLARLSAARRPLAQPASPPLGATR